jgi:peptidoglycan/LPS O-acetylase OafA/YrhL
VTGEVPGADGMTAREPLGYVPALDGVRALAIAIVVAFHAFGWPGQGTLGVDLFFVLSGFLITTRLLEEHQATGKVSIRRFYGRRARRLLPALLVLLTPFLLLAAIAAASTLSLRSPLFVGLASALTYTSNIVVAADVSAVPAGMVHLWSLAAEEQFYIIWPLLLVVLVRTGGVRLVARALATVLIIVIIYRLQLLARGASIQRLYFGPDTHADSLLVGCALGCYFVGRRRPFVLMSSARSREALIAVTLGLIVAATFLLDLVPQRLAYETQLLPTAFALLAALFIACTVSGRTVVARGLSARPVVFLGQISYSLYLWHLPVLVAFAGVDREAGWRTVAAVTTAVALAACSWRFIERPFLGRRREAGRGHLAASPAPLPA